MIGIDVSKATLMCAHCDPATKAVVWNRAFANTQAGIKKLLSETAAELEWVVEPTGRYSLLVVQQAIENGRKALLAPTRQSKAFCRS
jgi:transposase